MGDQEVEQVFCCKMREKFVVSIVGVNDNVPDPIDLADMLDWEQKSPNGFPIIYLQYCAFCGKKIDPRAKRRLVEPSYGADDEDDADNWKNSVAD